MRKQQPKVMVVGRHLHFPVTPFLQKLLTESWDIITSQASDAKLSNESLIACAAPSSGAPYNKL